MWCTLWSGYKAFAPLSPSVVGFYRGERVDMFLIFSSDFSYKKKLAKKLGAYLAKFGIHRTVVGARENKFPEILNTFLHENGTICKEVFFVLNEESF